MADASTSQYGTGSASGFLGIDRFCFIKDKLCVPQQTFGQAVHVTEFFANTPVDGLCGMAFQVIAVDFIKPPFLNIMDYHHHSLDNPYFTVILIGQTATITAIAKEAGGKYDSSTRTTIQTVITPYFQYDIDCKAQGPDITFKIGGKSYPIPAKDCINNIYDIDCKAQGPDITFKIGGKSYPIPSKDYIVPLSDGSDKCVLAMQGQTMFLGPSWILGDTWIRAWCRVYDPKNKRLGFAKAKM